MVVDSINNILSFRLFPKIEIVYVGDFDILKQRSINALYQDGAIYVSNAIKDEATMSTDIVHELGHSLEDEFGYEIYADEELKKEFLIKRHTLLLLLKKNDIELPIAARAFSYTEFDQTFDDFLYKQLGYDKLALLTANSFLSPYSVTSLSEYFAVGFEHFFLFPETRTSIKKMCPCLYRKMLMIDKINNRKRK
jgi:hypothetical protein